MTTADASFVAALRGWRRRRGVSQLELACEREPRSGT
jgi:hypothetical protein